jgi:hypothetical protein
MTDRRGYLGSLGDHHFTVEFPWEPGAKSKLFMAQSKVRDELLQSGTFTAEELNRMGSGTSLLHLYLITRSTEKVYSADLRFQWVVRNIHSN